MPVSPSPTRLFAGLSRHVPLGVARTFVRRGVVGVNYHAVSDDHLPHVAPILRYKSTRTFGDDLDYLERACDVVDYPGVVAAAAADERSGRGDGGNGRGPRVHITFDDGYAECFSVVRPALAQRGIPCTFFVITEAVDNRHLVYTNKASLCIDALAGLDPAAAAERLRSFGERFDMELPDMASAARWLGRMQLADTATIDEIGEILGLDWDGFLVERRPFMTGDEIRQLAREGFTIGAHSRTHPYMKTLTGPAAVEDEIVESCRAVQELTGQDQVPFAFPFSADGLDRDVLDDLRRRHDFVGLMFDTRELRRDRPFIVNRIPADGGPVPWDGTRIHDTLGAAYRRHLVDRFAGAVGSTRARISTTSSA